MRVYELAKELGLTSKEVIERLAKLRVTVKGHMSTVDDAVTEKLRAQARPAAPARPSPAKPAPAKASA
jgi:translation initiation factor IF-2